MSKLSRFTLTSGERYLILFEKSTFYSGINDILDLSNNEILAINEFSNRCKKILKADLQGKPPCPHKPGAPSEG